MCVIHSFQVYICLLINPLFYLKPTQTSDPVTLTATKKRFSIFDAPFLSSETPVVSWVRPSQLLQGLSFIYMKLCLCYSPGRNLNLSSFETDPSIMMTKFGIIFLCIIFIHHQLSSLGVEVSSIHLHPPQKTR